MGSDFPDIMWFNTFNRYVKHVFLSHFTNWKAETNRNGGSSYPGLSPKPMEALLSATELFCKRLGREESPTSLTGAAWALFCVELHRPRVD